MNKVLIYLHKHAAPCLVGLGATIIIWFYI